MTVTTATNAAGVAGEPEVRSYYGQPIIKAPPWSWEIPAYLFVGGMAGVSAGLAFAARLAKQERLARSATFVALGGVAVSPALLIAGLGRPERFVNMMRVFKPTSPMSVGVWVLAASGTGIGVAAGCEALGILPRVKLLAQAEAGVLGLGLATYTAALLADTAVPVWHASRFELPFVFAGSSAASAGAAAAILTPPAEAGPARRLAVAGAVLELAAVALLQRRLGPLLGETYRHGAARRFRLIERGSTLGGAALLATLGRRRPASVGGGSLLLVGSLLGRFATFNAGLESTRDPKYTVLPQRERLAARAMLSHEHQT